MDSMDQPPAAPLFDITGMEPAAANDYVLSIVAHLKQTEADLAKTDEDVKLWTNRLVLADQAGRADLRQQAQAQRDAAVERRTKFELEVWEFRDGVEKLKKQLKLLPSTQRTINPDALLEALTTVAGPLDQVTPAVKRAEADDALAALKKRLAEDKT